MTRSPHVPQTTNVQHPGTGAHFEHAHRHAHGGKQVTTLRTRLVILAALLVTVTITAIAAG